ncbi:expressed unknown protein [Seminavis robusta]|uniref:ABC transporter domain-containing protein n=1 Tax=Seminavis robusta TaxID=568900 RepID=A0A9N8ECQ8_9STRA|nr:expressed unknown protein [Seminavis robusta]|eukprot:Sro811_g205920.1 n/a (884) ;mRNA; r:27463-30215
MNSSTSFSTAFEDELFFGVPLSTDRRSTTATTFFQFEALIAAISILFFRTTWNIKSEPVALRWFFALILAVLAFSQKSYELVSAVELFSYAVPWILVVDQSAVPLWLSSRLPETTWRLLLIAVSGMVSCVLCHAVASGDCLWAVQLVTPTSVITALYALIPIEEFRAAYEILEQFQPPAVLRQQVHHLLFVTFHIQFGIGHLGIEFLTKEQQRRNELVRMDQTHNNNNSDNNNTEDNDKQKKDKLEKAHKFQRGAAPFIFFTAVPYMIQIIFYGNINKFAFSCLQHDLHRAIRLHRLFAADNHMLTMTQNSPTSPEAYAASMDTVVSTTYDMFNRKLFSLPKVILLPAVISKTPQMMAQIFPIIFLTDYIKGHMINYMTTRVETLQKEIQQLSAVRSKLEAFDLKNAELLLRSGSQQTRHFTHQRWSVLSVQIQAKTVVSDLIQRTKGFFAWIQRNFVFSVLVDCALANLIAIGKIGAAEIFVFSRAIEDAVDMVLMKSRSEAELARMRTEIDKLQELATLWNNPTNKQNNWLHCKLPVTEAERGYIILRHVHYSRGTAMVHAEHVEIEPGIYALTGANGSGKSTLFRVLMSCDTNDKPIDCPPSIVFSSPTVAIVEKDDIIEDTICEATPVATAEEAVDDEEPPVCQNSNDDDTTTSSSECQVIDNEEDHQPVPKLSITMPSSHIVEISQTFYWPLYTRPIDWIYQELVAETRSAEELERRLRKTAELLQSMSFFQSQQPVAVTTAEGGDDEAAAAAEEEDDGIETVMQQLQEEKEDWFGDLSGGQKSKVELVRKVFLEERCPDVVLIDETFAPLDPTSKLLVMSKLKEFCKGSIVIVIYHADIGHGQETEGGKTVECVPSSDFFDHNIHLENQVIQLRPVC